MEEKAIFLEYFTKSSTETTQNQIKTFNRYRELWSQHGTLRDQQDIANAPDNFSEGFNYLGSEQTAWPTILENSVS